MKIHSLSTHPHDDGGVGEVCESTKHFWSLHWESKKPSNIILFVDP